MNLQPHQHILHRLHEDYSTNPNYGVGDQQPPGDSQTVPTATKKEGEEFHNTGEESREVKLADRILKAANLLASTPDVDEIVRCAEELKRMHGVTEGQRSELARAFQNLNIVLLRLSKVPELQDDYSRIRKWWYEGEGMIRRIERYLS